MKIVPSFRKRFPSFCWMYQLLVVFLVVALNLIWALQTPLVWQRFPITFDSSSGLVVSSIGICYSPVGIYPALPLMIGVFLVLALGNYLSYLGRRISTDFNESRWTAMAMVMTPEAFAIGLPILVLANDEPVPGYIIKAICSLLVSGATVCLIFAPKIALAYGWGFIPGESNPWRFVKGSSSQDGSKNNGKPDSHQNRQGVSNTSKDHEPNVISLNKIKSSGNAPSLTSLIETKNSVIHNSDQRRPIFSVQSFRKGTFTPNPHEAYSSQVSTSKVITSSDALVKILQDDHVRRRFRRYLQTLKMEENVRFWDSIIILDAEKDEYKRYVSVRAVIQTFILDSSPLQVNLSSTVRDPILKAFKEDDRAKLSDSNLFQEATQELFEDLRQSDAFRVFLENDTFSHDTLMNRSRSDPNAAQIATVIPSTETH